MNLNIGVENAHVRDTTATSGLINLLVGPWSGFLLRPLFGLLLGKVSGTVRRLPTRTAYGWWKDRKGILESDPILGLARGLQYPYYRGAKQADVKNCMNLQADMADTGINMGIYNDYEVIRRWSIRHLFRVNVKQSTTVTIGANARSNCRVSHNKDTVVWE